VQKGTAYPPQPSFDGRGSELAGRNLSETKILCVRTFTVLGAPNRRTDQNLERFMLRRAAHDPTMAFLGKIGCPDTLLWVYKSRDNQSFYVFGLFSDLTPRVAFSVQ